MTKSGPPVTQRSHYRQNVQVFENRTRVSEPGVAGAERGQYQKPSHIVRQHWSYVPGAFWTPPHGATAEAAGFLLRP